MQKLKLLLLFFIHCLARLIIWLQRVRDDTFFTNGRERPIWISFSTFLTRNVRPKCFYHCTKQDRCGLNGSAAVCDNAFFAKWRTAAILDFPTPPFCTLRILYICIYYLAKRHCYSLNGLATAHFYICS